MTTLPLLALYRLRAPHPPARVSIWDSPGEEAYISRGPVTVQRSVPEYIFSEEFGMGTAITPQTVTFPDGTYLAVIVDLDSLDPGRPRTVAALRVAEIASIVELQHPDIIFEKVFEDVIHTTSAQGLFHESLMRVISRPLQTPEQLRPLVALGLNALDVLPKPVRHRFALCSRWFRRGADATNPIDRFLFYYIVLEVFPGAGSTDIPGRVRDFLHQSVYPQLTRAQIKERSLIGRITGLRGAIAHDGIASADMAPGAPDIIDLTERLEALCRVALRSLVGLSPGASLDRWLLPAAPAAA